MIFQKQPELVLRFQRDFDTMWAHSRDFAGKDLVYELSTSAIPDTAIPDTSHTSALFTSANFTVKDTTFSATPTNTVADAFVAKKKAVPALDVRVYLDGQEFITGSTRTPSSPRCRPASPPPAPRRRRSATASPTISSSVTR